MNEISTPIQSLSAQGNIPENTGPGSIFGQKSHKEGKRGAFSRLLDSLAAKPGKNAAGAQGLAASGRKNHLNLAESEEGLRLGKGKKASLGKGNLIQTADSADSALGNEFSGLLGQNLGLKIQMPQLGNGKEGEAELGINAVNLAAKAAPETGAIPLHLELAKNSSVEFEEAGALEDDVPQEVLAALLGEEQDASDFLKDTQKPRKGAVDLLNASARQLESSFFEFSGEKRPGLVDNLQVIQTAGENLRDTDTRTRKTRDKINVEVRDMRTAEGVKAESADSLKPQNFSALDAGKADIDIPVDLRLSISESASAPMDKAAFEDALASELRGNLGTDIVKQASIIVRDGGEGTIKLTLRPESLGNVKIRLEMTENKITGHIIVENSDALKAFERELPVLEKQFQESGFSEAHLDMSMSQNGGGAEFYREESGELSRFAPVVAASHYDAEAERAELVPQGIISHGAGQNPSVNMLV
ncbi:flagellar hook-length control protein FliK [Leadbettera azotonutricia]|uniref:Putative flagellar hook-length control protein n=1 Tax=Leadbettera azotonutricia (strain ATCC BAA-888 / DSM 13862 / ZAS-9) TaxID=545695 RepID=F5YEW3_LEAAZ|nr:flagellar hook-length control protein FliK [Leadbettera azotonutricia]AEF81302.1 putative flagellar hook-length control protein [Leadbettera azotonutricia ZAS-9]